VACGDAHTAFVSEDGESVYTSGCGEHGRLGFGDEAPQHRPARLGGAAFGTSRVVMLSAGSLHSAAVTHDGALFTWGHGRHGKLGHGDRQGRLLPTLIAQSIFGGRSVVMTACGAAHTLILTEDGMVYSCGNAEFGQLGHGDERALSAFKQLDGERFCGQVIEMVAAGGLHSAAVSRRGDVWTWGRGIAGQLGLGDTRRRLVPNVVAVTKFGGSPVLVVSCGLHFTAAVTDEGAVWSWGKGVAGQLGLGDRENRLEPTRIWRGAAGLGGSRVSLVACGFDHTLAVDRNGNVWSWGRSYACVLCSCVRALAVDRSAVNLNQRPTGLNQYRCCYVAAQRGVGRTGARRHGRPRGADAGGCHALRRQSRHGRGRGCALGGGDGGRCHLHVGRKLELRTSTGRTWSRGPHRSARALPHHARRRRGGAGARWKVAPPHARPESSPRLRNGSAPPPRPRVHVCLVFRAGATNRPGVSEELQA
jgi:hypothetical protein